MHQSHLLSIVIDKMTEKLCLKWKEFENNISETFRKLRADKDYFDVTLVCEDGEHIEAHRVILAASSNFFQKLFETTKHPQPLIYLKGMKSEDLLAILDFVYFGEAKVYQENLDNFLSTANEFQMKGLMNQIDDGVQSFETKKEPTFKPVTNLENTQWIEETENIHSKTGSNQSSFDIDTQVKSMMEKSKNLYKSRHGVGHQKAEICKVCGKEGDASSIKYHIERSHLGNFVVLCDQCDKSYSTRNDLRRHKKTHS